MPLRLLLRRRAGRDHDEVGGVAVGDERLGAVDDPAVAVLDGSGLQRRQVGATGGLGHPDRGEQLAARDAREPALALLLGGQLDEVRRHDVGVDPDTRRECRVDVGELLEQHRVEPVVPGAGTAVLLGDLQAEEALLARGQPEVPAERLVGEVLLEVRADLAVQELADGRAERLVVLVVDGAQHVRHRSFGCYSRVARCVTTASHRSAMDSPIVGTPKGLGSLIVTNRLTQEHALEIWPGKAYPLGATFDGTGTNFALFSEVADRVELCLFEVGRTRKDDRDPDRADRGRRLRLALLPALGAAGPALRLPGARTLGPEPRASAATPTSCCSTPTPRRPPARSTGTSRCSATTSATPTLATTTTRPRT